VRDPERWRAALTAGPTAARELGLTPRGAVASPLPGPSGNVEYFLRLTRDGADLGEAALRAAVEDGPQ
jgi:23S rRNA (cytidine1920-2'-O)/16S rRNA (cytidine1409-2'-O)-methyltransferase